MAPEAHGPHPRSGGRLDDRVCQARPFVLSLSKDSQPVIRYRKMGRKLQQGDRFPNLTLNLTDGTSLRLPEEMLGRYLALLFYRGHW